MTLAKIRRPAFVGENWGSLPQGYRYLHKPRPRFFEKRPGVIADDWLRLISAFESAKNGDFQSLSALPTLALESEDFHVRSASLRILGEASPRPLIGAIARAYSHPDVDTRLAAYAATARSAELSLARQLAAAARKINHGFELDFLADSISELLEYTPKSFVEPRNITTYQAQVNARIDEIEGRIGSGQPVLFGDILSVARLVDKIRDIASSDEAAELLDLLEEYLLFFEGHTGIINDDWFDTRGTVDPRGVLMSMDHFENSAAMDRFDSGSKYFFGHLVPWD